ncbi:MAG TPA: c-type cytochrome domain-containing protein [Pirellulaceae bacterium]|nr:c-type cytochrome domain-containing protein [Pirellulaceae bacterium]
MLPILRQKNCTGCHQPAKKGGEYVMTDFAALLKGGESGSAAVVPGDPKKSYLIDQITPGKDGKAEMPKELPPLTSSEIDTITKWIAQGAKDDTPASNRPQYDAAHPPIYMAAPVLKSVEFSPDGTLLAVSGYHEVLLHKADGSALAGRLVGQSERIESARFSPDGKFLAVSGGSPGRFGELQIWDVEKRELKLSLMIGYDTLYGASWAPSGKMVAIGCADNTVRAFDAETGKQVLFNGAHSDWVLDTTFSVGSDHIISVSRDMSMKLIEVKTERFIDNLTSITPGALKGGLISIDRHPTKDELLCGGSDGAPKIFKMVRTEARKIGDNANLLREFAELPGRVFGVAYNHDGSRIAAGSSSDGVGEVRVYNAMDGAVVWKVSVPEGGIFTVDFNKDSTIVAAGGFDGDVRLYNATDGTLIKRFTPVEITGAAVAAN